MCNATIEPATETTPAVRQLETEVCGRCGGSGKHSYCQRYGDMCFGCSGQGKKYTKRGHIAYNYFVESLKVKASELRPGIDEILSSNVPGISSASWHVVKEVGMGISGCMSINKETGERIPSFDILCENYSFSGLTPDSMVRKRWSKAERNARLEAAIDYQDTLTKTGTVRKRGKNAKV